MASEALDSLIHALNAHFEENPDNLEGAHTRLPPNHPFHKILQRKPVEGWTGKANTSAPEDRNPKETSTLQLDHFHHITPEGTLVKFPGLRLKRDSQFWDDDVSTPGPSHTIPLKRHEFEELSKHFGNARSYDHQK